QVFRSSNEKFEDEILDDPNPSSLQAAHEALEAGLARLPIGIRLLGREVIESLIDPRVAKVLGIRVPTFAERKIVQLALAAANQVRELFE
ncbi:MAG: hypothetical protein KDD53_12810, partial [Bdellovibrionales bacterium]|nr:hypothetical protein [Bdellovibrionales bacterium]